MAAAASTLEDFPDDTYEGMDAVDALAARYATFARAIREAADVADAARDTATNDLFVEVSRGVDKDLWFLEAHLQKGR